MIGEALGWKLDKITDEIQPKIAAARVASEFLAVDPGYVCGLIQDGVGYRAGQPVITLHMEAYLGAPESYDAVEITGSPALKMKIAGGVHGDIATDVDRRQFTAEDSRGAAGAAHHAGYADSVVFRRREVARSRRQGMDGETGPAGRSPRGAARRGRAERSGEVGPSAAEGPRGEARSAPWRPRRSGVGHERGEGVRRGEAPRLITTLVEAPTAGA